MHLLSELILLVLAIFKVSLFFRRLVVGDWVLKRFKKTFLLVLTATVTDMKDIKIGEFL